MMDLLIAARRYDAKATELRQQASSESNDRVKAELLQVAELWRQLGRWAERRDFARSGELRRTFAPESSD